MQITLQQLYAGFRGHGHGHGHEVARALLEQLDWFYRLAELDPKTGEALPQPLSPVLAKIAAYVPPKAGCVVRDRLWRIAQHSRGSVERLFRGLNESPRREQALLPVHAVRELDANSFIKLSNRPGRNIREKLAGKPYLQVVRRTQSVDLPENRLLKAFVGRLEELLGWRRACLGEQEDDFSSALQAWLHGDEARAIGAWDNFPPNNTLLSHRDYRRVWDAWRWLQTLDDDLSNDLLGLEERRQAMRRWQDDAKKWSDGGQLFAEMPVLFDHEKLQLRPWLSQCVVEKAAQRRDRAGAVQDISSPACVDLSVLRPRYAIDAEFPQVLRDSFFWQHWKNADAGMEVELFNADAAYLHADAMSLAVDDLFFSRDKSSEYFDRCARAFASKLKAVFKNETLIWLVPDALNDFELEVVRRNLNAHFDDAEPLPRSVAAAFARLDFSRIRFDGFPIVVTDRLGGKTCITKLVARFDEDLKKRLPETDGYYLERCPCLVTESDESDAAGEKRYELVTVDASGKWHHAAPPARPHAIDWSPLQSDESIGHSPLVINVTERPESLVAGGMRLHALQQRSAGIALWRDQIPELAIKVVIDGRLRRFPLVSRGTTIRPVRGQPVSIPVNENFELRANIHFFQFRLFQGENADDLGFSARLDSPAFPLQENVPCKLQLSFEYGADEPYKLFFIPLNHSFLPVRATWRKTPELVVTDAPSPEYPLPTSWAALQVWKDAQGRVVDLLEWLGESLERLGDLVPHQQAITLVSNWKEKADNQGGYWYAFAKTDDGQDCYCNTRNMAVRFDGHPSEHFPVGLRLFAEVRSMKTRISAFNISLDDSPLLSPETRRYLLMFKERSLQNRMSLIWGDARSLQDSDCPADFRDSMGHRMSRLLDTLPSEIVDRKLMFLLACMHRDAPQACIQWLFGLWWPSLIRDPRAIGLALGDVSQPWQQDMLHKLVTRLGDDALRVFAYAIWREHHFVYKFSALDLKRILEHLAEMLGNIFPCPRRGDEKDRRVLRDWSRATAEPLELLLGLLRTRASPDSEIKMLLQPHQKITKVLSGLVERVADVVAQSNASLSSRVEINIEKPEGEQRTPDLLYALRLYLTGDDGANSIHIASISDSDGD